MAIKVTLIFILLCIMGGEVVASSSDLNGDYIIESGKLRLAFNVSEKKARLVSLMGMDHREWLSGSNRAASVWKLVIDGPSGAKIELNSADAELSSVNNGPGKDKLRFGWDIRTSDPEKRAGRVYLDIKCPRNGAMSDWSARVETEKGWKLKRFDFPLLPNIKLVPGLKMSAPIGWGVEYDAAPETDYEGRYPSCSACMQFVSFYGSGKGLYIGMHDKSASYKSLNAKGSKDSIGFTCNNWTAFSPKDDAAGGVKCEAKIGFFDGGYYEAAQIYREFALSTIWGKAGPVSKRPIPQWLKDTDLWLMPAEQPLSNLETCKKAKDYFGVPIALHWYNWHQIPFDTLYPEYFPAKEHFAEGVKALQNEGFHVMPYINGRLCDPNSDTWTKEHGNEWAVKGENGEPYIEVYGSKVRLSPMCPYTPQWQSKIIGLVDRLVNECGVDGVYIDQIGCAYPEMCYDPSHDHPLGGGDSWVSGYRTLLNAARKKLPKDRMLTTEENSECWIDQFDALLLVNSPTSDDARLIPLFPAVYSGMTIPFGFQYMKDDDITKSIPFRFKMARAFLWGSQLGWINVDVIMAPRAAKEAEFLRNLAQCRHQAHKYLALGRFLGMLDVTGDNPRLKCEASASFGGTYNIDTPAVLAAAWQAEDGSIAAAAVNMSDDSHEVEIKLPGGAGSQKIKIEGRSVAVLAINKK